MRSQKPSMPNCEPISVLVETDEILAINKPAGLATTGRTLDDPDCLQYRAIDHAGQMVWALHQLDRDTSGVILFARHKRGVAEWQSMWNSTAIQKFYVALVHGSLPDQSMTVDAALRRLDRGSYTEVLVDDEDGKPAKTRLWQLSTNGRYSLVLAKPITGRTHQVRVHLQYAGSPLIGEKRYNAIPCGHHHRHALHALAICTNQPAPLGRIEAPLADDLYRPAETLEIDLEPLENWAVRVAND